MRPVVLPKMGYWPFPPPLAHQVSHIQHALRHVHQLEVFAHRCFAQLVVGLLLAQVLALHQEALGALDDFAGLQLGPARLQFDGLLAQLGTSRLQLVVLLLQLDALCVALCFGACQLVTQRLFVLERAMATSKMGRMRALDRPATM